MFINNACFDKNLERTHLNLLGILSIENIYKFKVALFIHKLTMQLTSLLYSKRFIHNTCSDSNLHGQANKS